MIRKTRSDKGKKRGKNLRRAGAVAAVAGLGATAYLGGTKRGRRQLGRAISRAGTKIQDKAETSRLRRESELLKTMTLEDLTDEVVDTKFRQPRLEQIEKLGKNIRNVGRKLQGKKNVYSTENSNRAGEMRAWKKGQRFYS